MSTKKLSRLEKKFLSLQAEQERRILAYRQERKELKKQLENERYNYIIQTIKKLNLPVDNPAILIGSLVALKKVIDEQIPGEIDKFIDLYNEFSKQDTTLTADDDNLTTLKEGDITE